MLGQNLTDKTKTKDGNGNGVLRIALPSDGELYDSTMGFMLACGIPVSRPNSRRYTGTVPAIPGVEVLFQRTSDVAQKVEEGSAELGVTGLDRVLEYRNDEKRASVLIEDLEYGRCDFVIAVPNSWMDVTSLTDLADLALEFRQGANSYASPPSTPDCCGVICTNAASITSHWSRPAVPWKQLPPPVTRT